ncbi:MAG TPA: NDP-sugar synthase [Aggregatilineales bacterium]|nr:NDP-sugar synthase [Aggregatilineales bacterium]
MLEQAVIFAMEQGTRLGTLSDDRPRAMLPVLGKPIVARVMDRIYEAGIRDFIVVVGEQEGEVASYLSMSWVPDANLHIALQPLVRGPIDSLLHVASMLNGPFLLAPAAILTPPAHIPNMIKRFNDTRSDLTLSLVAGHPRTGSVRLPGVRIDGSRVVDISTRPAERGGWSAFPLYACSKQILNYAETHRTDADGTALGQNLLKSGRKVSAVVAEWFMPLVNEIDLLTINKRMLREGRDTHILSELPGTIHISPPVRIDPGVSVGQGAKIGPNVYLESGASVGCEAVIWDSLVLRRASIADREIVHGQIVARQSRISDPSSTEIESSNETRP